MSIAQASGTAPGHISWYFTLSCTDSWDRLAHIAGCKASQREWPAHVARLWGGCDVPSSIGVQVQPD